MLNEKTVSRMKLVALVVVALSLFGCDAESVYTQVCPPARLDPIVIQMQHHRNR